MIANAIAGFIGAPILPVYQIEILLIAGGGGGGND